VLLPATLAIKVLIGATDPEAIVHFERETRLLASLGQADGFVPILDAGNEAGKPYLVMPLLTGGTLRARLTKGPLAATEAIALVRALAQALGRAHERGIVHRDLKPENVLFTGEGEPLVADLGLAKHFRRDVPGAERSQSLSASGLIAGTPGYMAPEQIDDARRDPGRREGPLRPRSARARLDRRGGGDRGGRHARRPEPRRRLGRPGSRAGDGRGPTGRSPRLRGGGAAREGCAQPRMRGKARRGARRSRGCLRPPGPDALLARALILHAQGETARAAKDAQRVLSLREAFPADSWTAVRAREILR
jgi:hypothetical protein